MSNSDAEEIVYTYLRIFRKCPHNPEVELNAWRLQLWSSALGGRYEHLKDAIYQQWLRLRFHFLALTSEVVDLLIQLRSSYLLVLITNGTSPSQWEKVDRLNLRRYFDGIFVSGDLPWEKPHPSIFFEACQFLGVEPHECIMIGDKMETDILGGVKAGLAATFLIQTSQTQPATEVKPDHVLSSVMELTHFLPKRPLMKRPTLPLVSDEDTNSNSSDGS
ncbi:N-acylneuraminate-9-phosphatase isoform X2 [Bemisia tabaci]|nr:PREDICTED: N-acylneuraminate-9-phosphatase isoform X2 [Bemisia tabaci]